MSEGDDFTGQATLFKLVRARAQPPDQGFWSSKANADRLTAIVLDGRLIRVDIESGRR